MIKFSTLSKLTQALPRCSLKIGCGELLITDSRGAIVGKITPRSRRLLVNLVYEHAEKVVRRLDRAGVPVEVKETDMHQITRILYDETV